jgi:hypothetical protein
MKKTVTALIIAAAVLLLVIFGYQRISADMHAQTSESIAALIRRYAVECYAVEGAYPTSIEYLEKNYGLVYNENKYIVSYESYSSNQIPSIEVLEKN